MDYGLVVGLNDLNNRPHEVFSRQAKPSTAKNIVIQGAIIQESLDIAQEIEGESILSFPSDDTAGFLYLSLNPFEKIRAKYPLTIAFTIDIKDQFQLYREAVDLRKLAKVIRNHLIPSLKNYTSFEKAAADIKQIMITKFSEHRIKEIMNPAESLLSIENISADKFTSGLAPFTLLTELIQKNLDQAIYALIVGLPVAIIGQDTANVQIVMKAFETLVPHRKLQKMFQTSDIPGKFNYSVFDLVGMDDQARKKAKLKSFVLVDLDNGRVQGGRKNTYCEKIINDLVDAETKSDKLSNLLIQRRIDWLLMCGAALTQSNEGQKQKLAADQLVKKIDRDTIYLIAKILESKNATIFRHLLKKYSLRARIFKALF